MRVCVTGASGKAGRATTLDLLEHGYEVVAIDMVSAPDLGFPLLLADVSDYGQTMEALQGVDAVVHLANIPAPGIHTQAITFQRNTVMNSNVFLAAAQLGLHRVVWASSETTLGLPFGPPPSAKPPLYAPVDEDHYPHPTSTYALSKVVGETLGSHVSGWSGIPFVGLRFSNIHTPSEYARIPGYWTDPRQRQWNLWGYIDVRDAALACRLGLEARIEGAENFIIAAADTVMDRPSSELMDEVFPEVKLTRAVTGYESLLSIDRAHSSLGFAPKHSWRQHL